MVLNTIVYNLLVDLIREDQQIVDDGDLGDGLQYFHPQHRPAWIMRRVEHNHLGLWGDRTLQIGRINLEPVLLSEGHVDWLCFGQLGAIKVMQPGRVRDQHLIPGIKQRQHRHQDGLIGSHRHHYLILGVNPYAILLEQLFGDGFSQLRSPIIGGIMYKALIQGLLGGRLDVLRRVEIGPSHLEVDYVPTFTF